MDFTVIKFSGQGSFKVKKGTIDKLLFFSENHRHLPITSVNDPSNVPKISSSKSALRPVIIAFGVPLIATETFLCLSESFLCHLHYTKSPHKISERKRYYNTLIYSSYNTFCGGPVSPP